MLQEGLRGEVTQPSSWRVAAAAWVRISSGVDYAIMLQNVGSSGLLGVRDGSSGSDGEDIHGSSGGKG